MNETVLLPDRLAELESITREYARFSRSAGGLGSVLGGLLCLGSYAAGGLLGPSGPVRAALIAIPFVWIVCKELMRRHYYQHLGAAAEPETRRERRGRVVTTAGTALISIVVAAGVLARGDRVMDAAGYLAVVAAMPVVAWLWLRAPLEFVTGIFLMCQAALAFNGTPYPLLSVAIVFPFAAVALIVAGVRDHLRFRGVTKRIARLTGGSGA
ncbi:MAG TPA: hypothetical protein VGB24_24900 [Longimicrobium sp.]|jgi:hypothetical protein|uniref:hypothetical protein n=1 Tax=Longimicrobium sp. TaxID=2029185 RepID=UPI002ED9F5FE